MRKRSSIESSSPITHNEEEREEAANIRNLDMKDRYMAHLQWKELNMLNLPTGDGLLHVQLEGQGENHSPLAGNIFVHV